MSEAKKAKGTPSLAKGTNSNMKLQGKDGQIVGEIRSSLSQKKLMLQPQISPYRDVVRRQTTNIWSKKDGAPSPQVANTQLSQGLHM